MLRHEVFLTGATGFLGCSLAAELVRRGHRVRALVRAGSEARIPQGCEVVRGDALNAASYATNIGSADTFVHLVGVAHPSPRKAEEFRKIDLVSAREAVAAAKQAGIQHFVYLSVSRPAPMMKAYQAVRAEGERMVLDSGIPATFVRPWYVLGPGRRWPLLLRPLYALARAFPPTRDGAVRLALVTLEQITLTLAEAVEHPPGNLQVFEPQDIRRGGASAEGKPRVVAAP
ncbi:MAG TPA: NAD(P)H-binding protein [Candidatus Bathyarchaeia archaeon]|nr:NAD(P)H-binding protein [Candidatus Bathyarchaeia archaeon]